MERCLRPVLAHRRSAMFIVRRARKKPHPRGVQYARANVDRQRTKRAHCTPPGCDGDVTARPINIQLLTELRTRPIKIQLLTELRTRPINIQLLTELRTRSINVHPLTELRKGVAECPNSRRAVTIHRTPSTDILDSFKQGRVQSFSSNAPRPVIWKSRSV